MEKDENMNNEDFDEVYEPFELLDENGEKVEFEFLDLIELDNEQYIVLLPFEVPEDGEGEVVILKVEDTDSEDVESYVTIEDDEELEKVFAVFKEKFKDEFNFTEE
ncbi:MAG: DUF1292 domain-containing protein [Clostridia bacterium]|nr:DUF1292 domain-containing protein [Clostridia bacterium]